jgi:sugar transferase (PEP-CTERM/EpsH1 system associated)
MPAVLFLAHRIPFPPDRGDKIRSFNILKEISRSFKVHLGCFADDGADAAHLAGLREAIGPALGEAYVEQRKRNWPALVQALTRGRPLSTAAFAGKGMQAFVATILAREEIDTIFAFSGQMAQFVPVSANCRFVMDFVDVDSAKFADYGAEGSGPMAWLHRREGKALLAFEQNVAARADVSLFVSDAEAELFRAQSDLLPGRVRAMGNGVDLRFYDPAGQFQRLTCDERGSGPLILFTGQMDYRPNVEAVVAFALEVMPLVRKQVADARFAVVGRNPAPAVRNLDGRNGTTVVGAVADVRSWLAAAEVAVAPLTIARGVQNKVLEAMAMAKPVVASSPAFQGIDAAAGRDLIVADGPEDQAAAILSLLCDPARAASVGMAARRRMESEYAWKTRLAGLSELLGLPPEKAAA